MPTRSVRCWSAIIYYDATPARGASTSLRFVGKVGTGYTRATLDSLAARLAPLVSPASPFIDLKRRARAVWVRPDCVMRAEFQMWTRDGRLRHASYRGLREDKDARDVVRET